MPGVAESKEIHVSKALKTGGESDPHVFVYLFERLLHELEHEWELLGYGFTLRESGTKITSLVWVGNVFILADSVAQYDFMVRSLTCHGTQVWLDLEAKIIGDDIGRS